MKRILSIIFLSITAISMMAQDKTSSDLKGNGNRQVFSQFELSASEGFHLQAIEKIGSENIYGILSIGTQCFHEDYKWGYGLGIGTRILNADKLSGNLELISYQINENEVFTDSYNGLQQLRFTLSHKLSSKLDLFGGPSFNVLITRNKLEYVNKFDSTFAPYEMFTETGDKSTIRGWIGFTAGIRFN